MPNVEKRLEILKSKIAILPNNPGVYQYLDENKTIIYVGKAKNLKKRVSSYFVPKNQNSGKLRVLVRKINDIQHTVVDTEQDALLLENNLIKQYQPRYNVLLKDDKTYPWICIKNEPFPRVFKTRNVIKDGSDYFGPYTSVYILKTIVELVRQLFQLRTCKYQLTQKNIAKGKFKPCLEYHIGNCLAPCIGKQTPEDYQENIQQIKQILRGNISGVKNHLKKAMQEHAENLRFEEAEALKKQLEVITNFQSKSTVVSSVISNVDVFTMIEDDNNAFVNYLKVIDGAIIQTHNLEIKKKMEESKEDIFGIAITEIRQRISSNSKEIIVPFHPDFRLEGIKLVIPERGDKKHLLDLSMRNAKYMRMEKLKQQSKLNSGQKKVRVLQTLKDDLRLDKLPVHIECFDNSNIQGTHPVAACVVFKEGKPAKKDYRHFNIKTVEGPNDFASMEEVVYRRYKRLLEEGDSIPQLIVIDGGKGQLGSAVKALSKLEFSVPPKIIGIAKRLEEIYFPGDPVPIYLDKKSESLKIIQHLRDEAHRFGITFHRQKRSNSFISSDLENITGIGSKTIEVLLGKFKSVDRLKTASEDDISALVGKAKATALRNYFKSIEK